MSITWSITVSYFAFFIKGITRLKDKIRKWFNKIDCRIKYKESANIHKKVIVSKVPGKEPLQSRASTT
jgi:hypothetical protein